MRTAIFQANFANLDKIRGFVGRAAGDAGMDEREVYAVQLATDEACTNIIVHAYGGKNNGQIEITCNIQEQGLTIILHDHGRSFEPAKVREPNLNARLEKRDIGGLGWYLICTLMDEVKFESSPESGNVLTLVKRKGGST